MRHRLVPSLALMSALAACSGAPGMEGLKANSLHSVVTVDKPYEYLAICVARRFDNVEPSLWDLPMPATGFRPIKGENTIEVFSVPFSPMSVSGVYAYFLTFKGIAPNRTEVDILASRDVHPSLGKAYVMTKVMDNLRPCGAKA